VGTEGLRTEAGTRNRATVGIWGTKLTPVAHSHTQSVTGQHIFEATQCCRRHFPIKNQAVPAQRSNEVSLRHQASDLQLL